MATPDRVGTVRGTAAAGMLACDPTQHTAFRLASKWKNKENND